MPLGEFDVIRRYFDRPARRAALGVGDDCALLSVAPGMQLATSCDMLVEGRHFFATVAPERLGHKALAVNLSDLAACGAEPLAFSLALALPRANPVFFEGFSRGLFALADAHGCELIGGDTTQGPLNICINVFGQVPVGVGALLRSGARAGDDLYVSGTLGDARLALELIRAESAAHDVARRDLAPDDAAPIDATPNTAMLEGQVFNQLRDALELPQPRTALGLALRGVASAAIDVSDGLLGDLGHVLQRSGVCAVVEVDAVPRSAALRSQPLSLQRRYTLSGGDDYELLFTAPADRAAHVLAAGMRAAVAVTRIGRIVRSVGPTDAADAMARVQLIDARGDAVRHHVASFDHFRSP
jgi:thiamine-monophosphate kinase